MKGPGVLIRKWGMLIVDEFKGHLTPETKATITGSSMKTDVVVTPGRREGVALQLQVLNVVVNKPFQDHVKQLYNVWLLIRDHALTPAGRIMKHTV
jgi:hypothetical protein